MRKLNYLLGVLALTFCVSGISASAEAVMEPRRQQTEAMRIGSSIVQNTRLGSFVRDVPRLQQTEATRIGPTAQNTRLASVLDVRRYLFLGENGFLRRLLLAIRNAYASPN